MANLITPPVNWGQPVERVASMAADFAADKEKPINGAERIQQIRQNVQSNLITKIPNKGKFVPRILE